MTLQKKGLHIDTLVINNRLNASSSIKLNFLYPAAKTGYHNIQVINVQHTAEKGLYDLDTDKEKRTGHRRK